VIKNHWKNIELKLQQKTIKDGTGCWLWQGSVDGGGYGRIYVEGQSQKIHRISAHLYLGYDLDDKKHDVLHNIACSHPRCWNPEHLYIGTHQSNMQDKTFTQTANNQNTYKTHCVRGHEFTEENTYISNRNKRLCKECARILNKEQYEKRKNSSLSVL
jgi:hypothetical protein